MCLISCRSYNNSIFSYFEKLKIYLKVPPWIRSTNACTGRRGRVEARSHKFQLERGKDAYA